MNNYIIIFVGVLIVIWTVLNFPCSQNNVLGAYIDLATGSLHNFSPGVVTIDGVMHHYPRLAKNYNFNTLPFTYRNNPLISEKEYLKHKTLEKLHKCNGRYNVAENAFLFISLQDIQVTGFISFDTGDECVLDGSVVIQSPDFIRIIGTVQLKYPTDKNVEYNILPGTALFQLDFDENDDVMITMKHEGVVMSYNCSK